MNENQTTPEQMQPDFCMTVKDNSMKPDGIHKGDKVAFVRCDYVENPSATVAPVKLEDFGIHNDTPLSSGTIVTGRVCYDAFVLDNKKSGIYYQSTT